MKLDEFITHIQQQLSDFREKWITAHSVDPEANPLELDSGGKWVKMFIIWKEGQDDGA